MFCYCSILPVEVDERDQEPLSLKKSSESSEKLVKDLDFKQCMQYNAWHVAMSSKWIVTFITAGTTTWVN